MKHSGPSDNITNPADALIHFLARQGIQALHNYPGGTIAPLLDACRRFGISVYTSRHEQGAGYAALAQAKLTGKPGIVAVTSGPGVTNVLTPVADAFFDSIPLLVLTGQVGTGDLVNNRSLRQSGFQEVDTPTLMRSITKAQFQPKTAAELIEMVPKAWKLASEGRPGPVSIDLPMDVQRTPCNMTIESPTQASTNETPCDKDVTRFCESLLQAVKSSKRPVIICGQGMVNDRLVRLMRELLTIWPAPVSQSLPAVGVIDGDHPLCLGFHGHTGSQVAGRAISESDLVLVLGSRLDVRQTGTLKDQFAPNARIFRIDLDPVEIEHSRIRHDEVIQVALEDALPTLVETVKTSLNPVPDLAQWHKQIALYRQNYLWPYPEAEGISPQYVLEKLSSLMSGQVICTTGVGAHQHWVARHFRFDHPERRLFTSSGHGAMGYDLPTAVGAAIHAPNATVLCVVGDGSFQMNIQELGMVSELELNIKILVIDNHRLALVSQFQLLNWEEDVACGKKVSPDFCTIAQGYGIKGIHCREADRLERDLLEFIESEGPVLMHLEVSPKHDVLPMLLGGQLMNQMWPWYDTHGMPLKRELPDEP